MKMDEILAIIFFSPPVSGPNFGSFTGGKNTGIGSTRTKIMPDCQ